MGRRRWGQHFLRDDATARRLVHAAGVDSTETVLEIGPGTGRLTRALLEAARHVVAVEIDPDLAAGLSVRLGNPQGLRVIAGDVLELDLAELLEGVGDGPVRCVANLPYESATPILARLLDARDQLVGISAVVQWEVAERIASAPGTRAYGYLSVRCQDVAEARMGIRLRPGAFRPPPKVDSAQIHFTPRTRPLRGDLDGGGFRRFVAGLFTARRKTLSNNLRRVLSWAPEQVRSLLLATGIDGGLRPEDLEVSAFADLLRAAQDRGWNPPGGGGDQV